MSILTTSFSLAQYRQDTITTSIGDIVIYQNEVKDDRAPLLFLHGLFFDHQMWKAHAESFEDRSIVLIDMPMHGNSKSNIKKNWILNDCSNMLLEIMDTLKIDQANAIGHSWGSMTIFRAALTHPERFGSTLLFNMPYESYSKSEVRKINMQHMGLLFKNVYVKQAAKTLFGAESLERNPELVEYLSTSMKKLSNREIKQSDRAVRIEAEDMSDKLQSLRTKHILISGTEDYIAPPTHLQGSLMLDGGHTLPLEDFEKTHLIIQKMITN